MFASVLFFACNNETTKDDENSSGNETEVSNNQQVVSLGAIQNNTTVIKTQNMKLICKL